MKQELDNLKAVLDLPELRAENRKALALAKKCAHRDAPILKKDFTELEQLYSYAFLLASWDGAKSLAAVSTKQLWDQVSTLVNPITIGYRDGSTQVLKPQVKSKFRTKK